MVTWFCIWLCSPQACNNNNNNNNNNINQVLIIITNQVLRIIKIAVKSDVKNGRILIIIIN